MGSNEYSILPLPECKAQKFKISDCVYTYHPALYHVHPEFEFPSIYLPHLSRMIPCSYWASACMAVSPSYVTFYVVPVRQARGLPVVRMLPHPASFRFHLAMDTLTFGYVLPTTRRTRVSHPLETCAAGRTKSQALCSKMHRA